ncbi:HTH_Tnp_Tc3_2 domain-containing protein [Trichonephila clavipes]|nr:HTH_Tnp_Tc3_2 domain-containing protein [Trichonephila clavipes]
MILRGRIIGRLECGRTQLYVSEKLGIAQSVDCRLSQRLQNDGNVSRCYSTGRPRVTTTNDDWYLAVIAKRNRRITASDLSRQLSSATSTTVSRQTVYRRLGHIGLYARRPVRCVPLTATHCRLRLTWSREHTFWTPQQWSCVMFSDESRVMTLPTPSQRFNKTESRLGTVVETVATVSMQIAAKKPKMAADILIHQLILMVLGKIMGLRS